MGFRSWSQIAAWYASAAERAVFPTLTPPPEGAMIEPMTDIAPGRPHVGTFPPFDLLERGGPAAATFLARAADAGMDHVCCGDHVSFAGTGFDGLVQATALAALHPTLPVHTGVYLLPLRHPDEPNGPANSAGR
jgi:hypothetical protein